MKKGFWLGLGLLMICHPIFAAIPTMKYTSQPSGTVNSFPVSYSIFNLAPVPQAICGATLSTGTQSATCSGLPLCPGSEAQSASFSCSVTTTCNSTAPANQSCTISLNVADPSALPASTPLTFTLSYGSYSTRLPSNTFTYQTIVSNGRTITFKNSCDYPVWFGSISGAAPSKNILTGGGIDCTGGSGDPGKQACVAANGACYSRTGGQPDACFSQVCASDSDCLSGASCYLTTNRCFWDNPVPTNGIFKLEMGGTAGDTNTAVIPEYASNELGVVWSGAFGGRTGCTSTACTSALCTAGGDDAEGVCSLGFGFQQPATQSEVTFLTYAVGITSSIFPDVYDVTVINGANVPQSMYPTGMSRPATGTNPFTCGAPGINVDVPSSDTTANTIGGSTWTLNTYAPDEAFRYVKPNISPGTRCTIDTDCVTDEYCGLTYDSIIPLNPPTPATGYLVCGTFAGWFTADQICGTNPDFTTALDASDTPVHDFMCTSPLSSPSGTMTNLYQCSGNYVNSCYQNGATTSCCGCVNWGAEGITILPVPTNPSYVEACKNENPNWTGSFSSLNQPQVYDTLLFLKESCPSCYTYPFDDASSTFTCTNGTSSPPVNNTVAYTIEYCPGGAGTSGFQPPPH